MSDVEFFEEKQPDNKPISAANTPSSFTSFLIRIGIVKTKTASAILLIFFCICAIALAIFLAYQNKTPDYKKGVIKYGTVDQTIFKNQGGIPAN